MEYLTLLVLLKLLTFRTSICHVHMMNILSRYLKLLNDIASYKLLDTIKQNSNREKQNGYNRIPILVASIYRNAQLNKTSYIK